MDIKSAYIHIPFCNSICSYCDFCKFFYNEELVDKYIDSLINEIKENYKGEILDTIYIGGGTPSSLNIKQLDKLLSFISNNSGSFGKNLHFSYIFDSTSLNLSIDICFNLSK